jgi:hypothetical protein
MPAPGLHHKDAVPLGDSPGTQTTLVPRRLSPLMADHGVLGELSHVVPARAHFEPAGAAGERGRRQLVDRLPFDECAAGGWIASELDSQIASEWIAKPAGEQSEGALRLERYLLNRPATTLIVMAMTAVPKRYESRACRRAVMRMGLDVRSVSDTW